MGSVGRQIEHLLFYYWQGEPSWYLISEMERLLACLKIYETKYPKEKLHGSFAHFFLSAHPVDSCRCNLPSKCYLQKVPVVFTRALGVFVGNGIVPLASPHASSCQTNFPQRVFTKSGGFCGNERKKNSSKKTFHLNTLLLCWFGAEKPEPGCSGERHGNLLQLLSTVRAIFWESAACWKQLHLGFAPYVLRETHCALSWYLLQHLAI